MSENNEMFNQFVGSGGANAMFLIGFLVYRVLSTKCSKSKHSKCHTCCLDMEWDDNTDDIENNRVNHDRTVEKSVTEVHTSNIEGLHGIVQAIIQDYLKFRHSQNRKLVGESGVEEQSKSITPREAQKFELRSPDSI